MSDELAARRAATVPIAADLRLGAHVGFFGFANAYGCSIGDNTRIGPFAEIQEGASLGANRKIGSHTFVCEGVTREDRCFVGHGVMFINDRRPAASNADGSLKTDADWACERTRVGDGASIEGGPVILCGVTIGAGSLVGAGAVVTRDVVAGTAPGEA